MNVYIVTMVLVAALALVAQYFDNKYEYNPCAEMQSAGKRVLAPYCHSRACVAFYGLAVIALIVVGGLRYHVGTDYWTYERNALMYANDLLPSLRSFNEPGIRLIARIGLFFNSENPAPFMFFASSALTTFLFTFVIFRYSDELFFPTILFILLGCWTDSFNGIRQYLAAAVFFCAIPSMHNRKFWKYLLIVLIASLFHKSALFLIPIYFVTGRKNSFRNLILIIGITVAAVLMLDKLLDYVSLFMEVSTDSGYVTHEVNLLRVLVGCAPAVFFWAIFYRKPLDSEKTMYLNLLLVNAVLWIVSARSAYLARVTIYTTPFLAIGTSRLLKPVDPRLRFFARWGMLILYVAFWWIDTKKSSNLRDFYWIFSAGETY